MLGIPNIPIFQILVLLPNDLPFVGARVRVLNATGQNVTEKLTGESVILTEANGQFATFLNSADVLPAGVYTVVTSNAGYADVSRQTDANFTGQGSFALRVGAMDVPAGAVPVPAVRCVSPMFPIEIAIPAPELAPGDWQLVETTIQDEAGKTSAIETPVVSGSALVSIQTRMQLKPLFHFVPDGQAAIEDPDFSGAFVMSAKSLSPSGEIPISGTVIYLAANLVPSGPDNDLTDYASEGPNPAKWIVYGDVVKFAGHYLDVMVWLSAFSPGYQTINYNYRQANGNLLVTNTEQISDSPKVQRVVIPEAPDSSVTTLELFINNNNGDPITEKLTVTYVHG